MSRRLTPLDGVHSEDHVGGVGPPARRSPEEIVRFCPQCGAPVVTGARFCVECGESLVAMSPEGGAPPTVAPIPYAEASAPTTIIAASPTAPTAGIGASPSSAPSATPPTATGAGALGPFAAVFGGILAIGVVVTILIMRQAPAKPGPQASAPPPAQNIGDGEGDSRGFPPGHPTVQIPKQALDFIKQIEQKANANTNDLAAWDQLGDVALRAAAFDPSYYPKAADAYEHVLKIDPENIDALRGMGNIDFDQRKFDEAIAAYEHYLSKKPDDPDVRTDLGTMYL